MSLRDLFRPKKELGIPPVIVEYNPRIEPKRVNPDPPRNGKRIYQAAQVDRLTADWIISVTSANAEILISRKAVISRCRQVSRDNVYARRIIKLYENNVVGHRGFAFQNKARDKAGKPDTETNRIIGDAWKKFMRRENFTVTKSLSGIECQKLAIAGLVRDGGILFRKRRGAANAFRWSLEPIEIDRLDHDLNRPESNTENMIQFGIETDKMGAPLFYHILTRHPGDVFAYRASPQYRERVPADEIIPIWTPERAGQMVGMPVLVSALTRLNILDKYDQAEAVAAFLASCKGGFLEKTGTTDSYVGEDDGQGNTVTEVQAGMIEELPLNYTYKPNDPQHPTQAYPFFVKTQLRGIASGCGVTYNSMANDLEGVNYSSIRAGVLEEREEWKGNQQLLVDQMMIPIFEEWLTYGILSGEIDLLLSDYGRLNQPSFRGRRWSWVDPLKDVQATILEKEAGLTSLTHEIQENNDGDDDFESICEQQKEDKETAEKYDLDFSGQDATKPAVQSGPINQDGEATPAGGVKLKALGVKRLLAGLPED